jgi:glycosyltransferase involved in cell wall biosynthesis
LAKALIEGAACGLGVLATPEAGFPIREGDTGFFVKRDADDIAQKLKELHANRALVTAMGAHAVDYARAHFSWDNLMLTFREHVESQLS